MNRTLAILFFALTSFTATQAARADALQLVFELPFDHAALHQMAMDMTAPNAPAMPYTADQIRQKTSKLSDAEYRGLVSAINSAPLPWPVFPLKIFPFKVIKETNTHHYLVVQLSIPGMLATDIVNLVQSKAALNTTFRNSILPLLPKGVQSLVTSVLNPNDAPKLVSRIKISNDTGGGGVNEPAAPKEGIPASAVTSEADLPGVRPSTLRDWYGISDLRASGLTGQGQDIAALAFGHVDASRVMNVYNPIAGVTNQPPIEVLGANTEIHDGGPDDTTVDQVENEVDLEMAGNVAPGAFLHSFVGGADGTLVDWVQSIDAILDDPRNIRIITSSYGFVPQGGTADCETQAGVPDSANFMDPLFDRAVAQGVTYLTATGDEGSDGCQNKTTSVEWPTTPEALQVGGTQANFGPSPDGTIATYYQNITEETGWIYGTGGESLIYDQPDWMKNSTLPGVATLSKHGIPDIALYADHAVGQPAYTTNAHVTNPDPDAPVWTTYGGTSLAAPRMAGFLALVNEARQKANKPPLLYVTPMLYRLQTSPDATHPYAYSNVLRDIIEGSNGAFSADLGWDRVTGLGSIQGVALLNYLVGQ